LIGGGANGGGALEGMLGMQLMNMMSQNPSTTPQNVVADTPVEVVPSSKKK
jgi:F0F1-type ATP synthase membrane subunit c/vacuolar-type H+-ATPase subunit K